MSLRCSNPRWSKCAGSVREETNYPNTSPAAANDGTGSHLLLEACLNAKVNADLFIGHKLEEWDIKADRAKRVQICVDYVNQRVNDLEKLHDSVTIETEKKINIGQYFGRDDWTGTCDITITARREGLVEFVEVIDYKDGQLFVDVVNNSQLYSYCYAPVVDVPHNVECKITIVQPKITKDPIRSEFLTRYGVCKFVEDLAEKAKLTDDPNAPLTTGKHCQWCLHKPNCKAIVSDKKEDLDTTEHLMSQIHSDLTELDNETLSKILDAEKSYIDAFTRAKVEVKERIERGENFNDYYLGKGKNTKKWSLPDDEIEKKLKGMRVKKDSIHPSKFLSPAQALKIEDLTESQLKNLEKLIIVEQGKPTLKRVEK